jgi:hypothetical protein
MDIIDVEPIQATKRQMDNLAEFIFGLEARYAYEQGVILVWYLLL